MNPPSKSNPAGQHESARQAYIRLLRERIDFPDSLDQGRRDLILKSELIEGGYLDGVVNPDGSGMFPSSVIVGLPKARGRLFLQKLEQQEYDSTWVGKLRKSRDVIIGFVLGVVGSVVGAIIQHLLHVK